ncbi:cinnamoyl coa reductase 1, partial [Prunus dulcis]
FYNTLSARIRFQQYQLNSLMKPNQKSKTKIIPQKPNCLCNRSWRLHCFWIVKLLLERGYTVRGTLRNPDDPKMWWSMSLVGVVILNSARTPRTGTAMESSGRAGSMGRGQGERVDLVVVNPVLVLGQLLQPTINASIIHVLKYLTGSAKTYANPVQAYVLHRGDVVEILAKFFPEYPIPTKVIHEGSAKMRKVSRLSDPLGKMRAIDLGEQTSVIPYSKISTK